MPTEPHDPTLRPASSDGQAKAQTTPDPAPAPAPATAPGLGPGRPSRPRIVILGGGFGGTYCAAQLERLLPNGEAELILIDRHNYLVFLPLLVEAGTGSLEPRHTVVGLRSYLRRTEFRMGEVLSLDTVRRTVRYRPVGSETETDLPFDHVVIALGSVTKLPPVPGLAEHGLELKTLRDAVALRDRAISLMEAAEATEDMNQRRAMLHWVIVGGSYTGVELAGEFHAFMREAAEMYRRVQPRDVHVTLVELGKRILPTLDEELSDYAADQLGRRGMDLRLGVTVRSIDAAGCTLSDGTRLDAHTVVWAAGIAPPGVVQQMKLPTDERGYILSGRDLRITGYDNIWAIGDIAANPDAHGQAYPATAQHAIAEGQHAARNIVATLRNDVPTPFNYRSKGMIAALGRQRGVARIGRFNVSGFIAWWLWRTLYLIRMPGLRRKLRLAIDWTFNALFGPEHVQLNIHTHPRTIDSQPIPHTRPPTSPTTPAPDTSAPPPHPSTSAPPPRRS
jgi:NADH dehydrogenase